MVQVLSVSSPLSRLPWDMSCVRASGLSDKKHDVSLPGGRMAAFAALASLAVCQQKLHFSTNFVRSTHIIPSNHCLYHQKQLQSCPVSVKNIFPAPDEDSTPHLHLTMCACPHAPRCPLPPAALAWPSAACIIEAPRPRGCKPLQQHT